eukprot:37352_1
MSDVKRFELIVFGYARIHEIKCNVIIPKALKTLLLVYYPTIINYEGKFLKENAGSAIKILNGYKFTGYRSVKLDIPLPVSMNDNSIIDDIIYRWKAKINNGDGDIILSTCAAYIFGVVSNRCVDFHAYPNIDLVDAYGISVEKYNTFWGTNNFIKDDKKYCDPPQPKQIVVMEYKINRYNQCKLLFYKEIEHENDESVRVKSLKFIYCVDLPQDKHITSWYPVFSKPGDSNVFICVVPYDES